MRKCLFKTSTCSQFLFSTGGPTTATSEALNKSTAAAKRLAGSMKARHPGSFGSRSKAAQLVDIDDQESEEDRDEELELWKLLPQLRDLPEAMVKKLPMSAMFHLNAALSKEKKTTEKLGVNMKLAHNAKKVAKNPKLIAQAKDNRKDVLHPARFLGGASSSLPEQWLEARRVIGEADHQ